MHQLVALSTFPSVEEIDSALHQASGIRFETQPHVPRRKRSSVPREPYDDAILAGRVPTREGSYHDLMNALVWAQFPKAKRAVHQLQHALIARGRLLGLEGRRLAEHDALAILDEGGVLAVTPRPLPDADALNAAVRSGEASTVIFGHGILECIALGSPKPLVGTLLVIRDSALSDEALDTQLATQIASGAIPQTPREFLRIAPELLWG